MVLIKQFILRSAETVSYPHSCVDTNKVLHGCKELQRQRAQAEDRSSSTKGSCELLHWYHTGDLQAVPTHQVAASRAQQCKTSRYTRCWDLCRCQWGCVCVCTHFGARSSLRTFTVYLASHYSFLILLPGAWSHPQRRHFKFAYNYINLPWFCISGLCTGCESVTLSSIDRFVTFRPCAFPTLNVIWFLQLCLFVCWALGDALGCYGWTRLHVYPTSWLLSLSLFFYQGFFRACGIEVVRALSSCVCVSDLWCLWLLKASKRRKCCGCHLVKVGAERGCCWSAFN